MRRIFPVLIASLLLLAQSRSQDAARLFQDRRYDEAVTALEEHLRANPRDVASHTLLGLAHQQLSQFGPAELSFLAAVKLQPNNPRPLYMLSRLWFLMGRFDQALAGAEQALKLGQSAALVHHLKGRIEEERGRLLPGLEQYRLALESDPKMAPALSGEASVLYKLNRRKEARASADAALQLDPSNEEALRIRKQIYSSPQVTAPEGQATPVKFIRQNVINFRLQHFPTGEKYLISTMAGGLAAFDFDGDGRLDLFFANGAEIPSLRKTGPQFYNRLYRNLGNWKFEDVTESQGLQGEGFSMGAAAADFDNDGRIDLFVPGVNRNLLYRNTPEGFVEVAGKAGIRDEPWSIGGAWVDYDRDGLLDLFVINYLDWKPEASKYCGDREKSVRVYCHPREYRGLPNRLYRNLGNGTFQDVSESSGISKHIGKGMSVAVLDADGDGRPDIFVTNDTEPNFLFHNLGKGMFEEAAIRFGVALNEQGAAISSMGVDAKDYNNDGFPDLIVTALTGENFPLFRSDGKGAFGDVTYASRLGLAAARRSGWGVAFGDLNNDGWKDLFSANSHVTDNVELVRNERYLEPNTVFLNYRGAFNTAQEIGIPAAHRGLVLADLDNDGRLDAIVTVLGEKPELWRNETTSGAWLRIQLEGHSLGARVRVGSQWQERTSATGYASSNLDALHFGLGDEREAAEVEVHWPNGRKQVVKNIKAGQTLILREPAQP